MSADDYQDLDVWRLSETLSIFNAACLISGYNPSNYEFVPAYKCDTHGSWGDHHLSERYALDWPNRLHPIFISLTQAIISDKLPVKLVFYGSRNESGYFDEHIDPEINGYGMSANNPPHQEYRIRETPDWNKSYIDVDTLKSWLLRRNYPAKFFFPESDENTAPYMNQEHPNFSKKLHAAVSAWLAVNNNAELMRGKTPKQALEKWLNTHAASYEFINSDGLPAKSTVENIAMVANWQTAGGAPATPVNINQAKTHPPLKKNPPTNTDAHSGKGEESTSETSAYADMDDDIPF